MPAEIPDGAFIVARAILNSSLWTMSDTDRITAITCIAICNWSDQSWFDGEKTITIQRGQFVRSRDGLAKDCNLTVQKSRTSIKHLEKVGFLTREPTSRYTLYTIPKYDFYQNMMNYSDSANPETNQQVTSGQPALNQELTQGQPAPNHKQVIYKGEEGKKRQEREGAPPEGVDQKVLRGGAEKIQSLFKCPQGVDQIMKNMESAMLRSGASISDIVERAEKSNGKYVGQNIWYFTESEWRMSKASSEAESESTEDRLKRLAE